MGRNARLKAERRQLRADGIKLPERGKIDDMLICPLCQAYSYPKKILNPKNEEEAKALICRSCGENVVPYIDALKAYQKVQMERKETLEKIKDEPTNSEAAQLDISQKTLDSMDEAMDNFKKGIVSEPINPLIPSADILTVGE